MNLQSVTVVFKLHGEIKRDLFLTNLASWIENANDQLLNPADIPNVDHIEIEIITIDNKS